jgi:diacylglycerol kinase family enzyme
MGSGVPLAVLPVGTANNLARSLGQVDAVRRVVAGWREGARAALDVGVVRGPAGEELFLEAWGGGAFARMIAAGVGRREADRAGFAGNRIDRGIQMLREAIAAEPCRPWRLRLDGERVEGELFFVEVMNVRFLGPRVPLAPEADPTDGWLDVFVAAEGDRAALLEYTEHHLHGSETRPPPIATRRCRRVEVEAAAGPLHVDDRLYTAFDGGGAAAAGCAAVEVTLHHAALEVAVALSSPPRAR